MSAPWEEHFDELSELDETERACRLEEIAGSDPDLACHLRKLLAADSGTYGDLTEPLVARAPGFVAGALAQVGPAAPSEPESKQKGDRTGERIGNYRLLSLLGRGGMAEVWLAERADGEFDSRVAIKLVRSELGSEAIVSGFLRERRILAQLVHPGIARLLDGGRSRSDEPYFVLEHVDGTPITTWCATRGLSVEERLRLMVEVCEAVDHAHRSLVVHRDLKPSNVLVDASGRPKLLDFGIAKLLSPGGSNLVESAATSLGGRAFTPAYAAPEQITGKPVTTATDVYALGVLLYEMLIGEKPFLRTSRSLPDLMKALEAETFELPSARLRRLGGPAASRRRAAQLEGDLDAIVAKTLAREPERRYPGAAALADDLRRYLSRRPVRARPPSMAYQAGLFVARHRLGVAAAALAILSLLGGLAVALWQARVGRAEALRAERARGFLVSVFESMDPEKARSEPVTPEKLLATGVRRVDQELAGEPAFQAEMLDLLANLHRKVGLLPEGRALAERSLKLRRELFGASSPEAAKSLFTLGWIRLDQGEPRVARDLLERAIADLERTEGPDSLAAADAREPLVEALFAGESVAPALPVAERRLATYRRILGDAHEKTGIAWNDRGVLLHALGRLDEAEADYRRSLAILSASLPDDDPRLAYPHDNLGDLLLGRGYTDEAERELRRGYELRRSALGPRHPKTAMSLARLAQTLLDQRQLEPAEAAARQVVEILADRDRFAAANAQLVLGQILFEQSRHEESLDCFDRGLSQLEAVVGSNHMLVQSGRGGRAETLLSLGRRREAIAELQRAIARLEAMGGIGDERRADLLTVLGAAQREEGNVAEARKLHHQARQLAVQVFGEENFRVSTADYELALDALAERNPRNVAARRAEAVALLIQARNRLRRIEPASPALPGIESLLTGLRNSRPPKLPPSRSLAGPDKG